MLSIFEQIIFFTVTRLPSMLLICPVCLFVFPSAHVTSKPHGWTLPNFYACCLMVRRVAIEHVQHNRRDSNQILLISIRPELVDGLMALVMLYSSAGIGYKHVSVCLCFCSLHASIVLKQIDRSSWLFAYRFVSTYTTLFFRIFSN